MAIEEMIITGKKALTDLAAHELGLRQEKDFSVCSPVCEAGDFERD